MKILVYGYGKMTSAMVEGWLRAGMQASDITVFNPRPKPVPDGVAMVTEMPDRAFDAVLLGFKPHMLGDIAPTMQGVAGEHTLVISVLAGITLDRLAAAFPDAKGCVRFMPNLAVAIGKSPNVLAARNLSEGDRGWVTSLAQMLGSAEWLEDEALFNLATALAGSGPGFVYRYIDALSVAATRLGMPKEMAGRLALAMVEGATALAASSDFSPGELADRVASPGGMTREGLNVLDAGNHLINLMEETLRATRDRGEELASDT